MARQRNRDRDRGRHDSEQDLESWIPSIIMLVIFWPVGLFMLVKKLQNVSDGSVSASRARPLSVIAWVLMALGVLALIGSVNISFFPSLFLLIGGVSLFSYSGKLDRARKRYDKYLAVVGNRKVMRLRDIAAAIPVSEEQARQDLEQMIADGRFPEGTYLDMSTRALVIDGTSVEQAPRSKPTVEPEPAPQTKPAPKPEPAAAAAKPANQPEEDPYRAKLAEIRRMDDLIENEEVSRKIRRIEEVTALIFEQVKQNPQKLNQIHTFMNYYLPTTLKLLSAYGQLERQTVEGENIRISKERIEKMLSQLVFAFEQQLDQMFEADALDISSDIAVLERMMAKDGLSENPYTLPKCPPKAAKKPEITLTLGGAAQAQAAQEEET
jgi:hypothetical protein